MAPAADEVRRAGQEIGKRLSPYGRDLTHVTVKYLRAHPEHIIRNDALLCSINDRLGALCVVFGTTAGKNIAAMRNWWLDDLLQISERERELDDENDGGGGDDLGESYQDLQRNML
jgi:hypothetical protein